MHGSVLSSKSELQHLPAFGIKAVHVGCHCEATLIGVGR